MKTTMRFWAAVLLVLGAPGLSIAQTVIAPSGDMTGKTDAAAINSALSSGLSAQLECNAHYYTDITIQVPGGASFVGPTVVAGGAGTGASITATEAGGVVTGLAISAGGSGYTLPATSILPVVYNTAYNAATIINPYCSSAQPCWAWMVHAASGGGYGVQIEGDVLNVPGQYSEPANLQYTGFGNRYVLQYLSSSGSTQLLSVVPQSYP